MEKIIILILFISTLSCTSVPKSKYVDVPELNLHFNGKEISLSNEAENYIESVVAIMKSDAIYRKKLNFDEIQAVIRYYADGAETVAGLGPLLDSENSFYTVEEGHVIAKAYYENGGYYDISAGEEDVAPLVQSTVNYTLSNDNLPVAVLTNFMTASSAEAVTAIFAGQPNVKINRRQNQWAYKYKQLQFP